MMNTSSYRQSQVFTSMIPSHVPPITNALKHIPSIIHCPVGKHDILPCDLDSDPNFLEILKSVPSSFLALCIAISTLSLSDATPDTTFVEPLHNTKQRPRLVIFRFAMPIAVASLKASISRSSAAPRPVHRCRLAPKSLKSYDDHPQSFNAHTVFQDRRCALLDIHCTRLDQVMSS
jgi:hypothetical protein